MPYRHIATDGVWWGGGIPVFIKEDLTYRSVGPPHFRAEDDRQQQKRGSN